MAKQNETTSIDRTEMFGAREGADGIIRCDACPVLCRIRPGRSGACARYANHDGQLIRTDPLVMSERVAGGLGRQPDHRRGCFRHGDRCRHDLSGLQARPVHRFQ